MIESEFIQEKTEEVSLEDKEFLYKLYQDNKQLSSELKENLESILFRLKPPTPEEYLDPANKWITKGFADSILPHIREDFCEILNQSKNYNQVVEYGATRLGKSFLVSLIIHYIVIFVHCLRYPQLYYGLAPTTSLSLYIVSFVTEKANQLLLKPIYDVFSMSPRMKQVKFQDEVSKKQKEIGYETIIWSKAATFGKLTLESKLTLNIGTDFMSFIGSNLLFLSVSEINFFIEKAGATHEDIFQIYSDGLERIKASVGDNYLGMVFLDSSANDEENKIEQYILQELPQHDKVFFRWRKRWEIDNNKRKIIQVQGGNLKKWVKTGETFRVCVGNNKIDPMIIKDNTQLEGIPSDLIEEVPIDYYEEFERNLLTSIKNIIGRPTRKENKFIQDISIINDIFDSNLQNVTSSIMADASEEPELLIWNQIKDKFFNKYNKESYTLKRAPQEPRWVRIDIAHSTKGDLFGIAMGHKEKSLADTELYIFDFAFTIRPGENGINITAVELFLLDLMRLGNVPIFQISSDSFQNKQMEQNIKRANVDMITYSVDKTIDAYVTLYNTLFNRKVKVGKNIFVKNNLNSLMLTNINGKEKIDHTSGTTEKTYNGDWEYSKAGIHAKDVSDCVAGVVYHMSTSNITPTAEYRHENKKFSDKFEDKEELINRAFKKIHKYY